MFMESTLKVRKECKELHPDNKNNPVIKFPHSGINKVLFYIWKY